MAEDQLLGPPYLGTTTSNISAVKSSGWIQENPNNWELYRGGVMLADSVPDHLVFR